MLSINSCNYSSITRNLVSLGAQLAISNERLATSLRVNRASDDPSGIVAATNFSKEIAQLDAMTSNGQRISNMADAADGALAEISTLLDSIETNLLAASGDGVDADDLADYQANIDLAVDAIDRLISTTKFNGQQLLNGSIGYTASNIDTDDLTDVRISSANLSSVATTLDVSVTAAERGTVIYDGGDINPAAGDTTIVLTGPLGSQSITFSGTTTKAQAETIIDTYTTTTGIDAEYDGDSGNLYFRTQNYGSDQAVSISVTAGSLNLKDGITSDYGINAAATVGGYSSNTSGQTVYFNTATVSGQFTLTDTVNTAGGTSSFTVSGSGANWRLDSSSSGAVNFGISNLSTALLGNADIGYLRSLKTGGTNDIASENFNEAEDIIDVASSTVTRERARLGALKNYTIDSTLNSIADTRAELSSAYSDIMDLDYTAETANNDRLELLYTINSSLLSSVTQNLSNNILTLITGSFIS